MPLPRLKSASRCEDGYKEKQERIALKEVSESQAQTEHGTYDKHVARYRAQLGQARLTKVYLKRDSVREPGLRGCTRPKTSRAELRADPERS